MIEIKMEIKKNREAALKKNIHELLHLASLPEDSPEKVEFFSRINVMATTLDKEKTGSITNILLDDGSGKIVLRCFEENKTVEGLKVGESVLIIGRVRQYNEEDYISPEIVRKIPQSWLKLRAAELKRIRSVADSSLEQKKMSYEEEPFPRQKIIQIIKQLDSGEGVMIEEVMEKTSLTNMERWITVLLEEGDIYQIRPGRVKVL